MHEAAIDCDLSTISDMAARYNVSLRTLLFYERAGLLTPLRVEHQRLFSAHDEIKLQLILAGKRLGFSLREIDNLIRARSIEKLSIDEIRIQMELLDGQRNDVCNAIEELKASMK